MLWLIKDEEDVKYMAQNRRLCRAALRERNNMTPSKRRLVLRIRNEDPARNSLRSQPLEYMIQALQTASSWPVLAMYQPSEWNCGVSDEIREE